MTKAFRRVCLISSLMCALAPTGLYAEAGEISLVISVPSGIKLGQHVEIDTTIKNLSGDVLWVPVSKNGYTPSYRIYVWGSGTRPPLTSFGRFVLNETDPKTSDDLFLMDSPSTDVDVNKDVHDKLYAENLYTFDRVGVYSVRVELDYGNKVVKSNIESFSITK